MKNDDFKKLRGFADSVNHILMLTGPKEVVQKFCLHLGIGRI